MKRRLLAICLALTAGCSVTFEEARMVSKTPVIGASSAPVRDDARCKLLADDQRTYDARAKAFVFLSGASGLGSVGAGLKDIPKSITLSLGLATVFAGALSLYNGTMSQSTGAAWAKECSGP